MNKVTIIDKFLAHTFLLLIPKKVTPNQITIFRFVTVPFLLFLLVIENYILAIPLFTISAISDALDGARARVDDHVTDWGKMFDPVADKVLIGSVVALVVSKEIGPILAFIIILLEVFIVISALYKKRQAKIKIEARKAGKVKMVFQSVGVGLVLLNFVLPHPAMLEIATFILYLSIFFAVLSLLVYKSI